MAVLMETAQRDAAELEGVTADRDEVFRNLEMTKRKLGAAN